MRGTGRAAARTGIAVAVALGALVAAGQSPARSPGGAVPVVPKAGDRFPLGTPITGPCRPGSPLSGSGRVTRDHGWSSFVVIDEAWSASLDPAYSYTRSVRPQGEHNDGPCGAPDDQGEHPSVAGGGVSGFAPSDAGMWFLHPMETTTTWEYDDQDGFAWVAVEEESTMVDSVDFWVYDPCHLVAEDVRGRVLLGVPGRRPETVRPGTLVAQGHTLTVDRDGKTPGRVLLENPHGGYSLGFGPGEYQFSDIRKCRQYWEEGHHAVRLPEQPAKAEVEKGFIDQRFEEFGSMVKAGRDLLNEGIFSNLRRRQEDGTPGGRFEVIRRKGKTRSCAIDESLRVETKSKRVPAGKRELILDAGECAVTRDGRAPRRARG